MLDHSRAPLLPSEMKAELSGTGAVPVLGFTEAPFVVLSSPARLRLAARCPALAPAS